MTPEHDPGAEGRQRIDDIAIEFDTSEENFDSQEERERRGNVEQYASREYGWFPLHIFPSWITRRRDTKPGEHPPESVIVPQWRQMLRVFMANKLAVVSLIILIIITAGCYLGKFFYHTNQTDLTKQIFIPHNLPPSWKHPFGTDQNGYDVLGRIMFAGEYSLTLGFLAGTITIFIGTLYGMVSGYFGGIIDAIMMRILDAFLSIPYIFLLLSLVSIFGNSTVFLILVIGLTGWWGNARIIRSDALLIRDLEYSQAASSMGARKLYIIRRHVFPNSMGNIVTVGTFSVADAILFLSALGFLGLGIQLPATDWGTMLNVGVPQLFNGFWWEVFPVTAVFITVIVCINYVGDAMRDIFEVRYRGR